MSAQRTSDIAYAEMSKLLENFTAAVQQPKVSAAEDALHLAIAHGMFRVGTHSLREPERRAAVIKLTADCILSNLRQCELAKDPRQVAKIMFAAGNYSQKHVRDAALADEKKGGTFRSTMSTSKVFARVQQPFCNERALHMKLVHAMSWHQDLIKAMVSLAHEQPHLGPLVRCHLRGVRYGVCRQVQLYFEKLGEVAGKTGFAESRGKGGTAVSADGLYQWIRTYCEIWLFDFAEVEKDHADIISPFSSGIPYAAGMRHHNIGNPADAKFAKDFVDADNALNDKAPSTTAEAVKAGINARAVNGVVCGTIFSDMLLAHVESERMHLEVLALRKALADRDRELLLAQRSAVQHPDEPLPADVAMKNSGTPESPMLPSRSSEDPMLPSVTSGSPPADPERAGAERGGGGSGAAAARPSSTDAPQTPEQPPPQMASTHNLIDIASASGASDSAPLSDDPGEEGLGLDEVTAALGTSVMIAKDGFANWDSHFRTSRAPGGSFWGQPPAPSAPLSAAAPLPGLPPASFPQPSTASVGPAAPHHMLPAVSRAAPPFAPSHHAMPQASLEGHSVSIVGGPRPDFPQAPPGVPPYGHSGFLPPVPVTGGYGPLPATVPPFDWTQSAPLPGNPFAAGYETAQAPSAGPPLPSANPFATPQTGYGEPSIPGAKFGLGTAHSHVSPNRVQ